MYYKTRNSMISEENLSKIGHFAKPHGVKGEIALVTDFEMAGISGDPCIVCNMDGILVPFFIRSFRPKNTSTTLISFENMDSDDKVKIFTGKTAYIPSRQLDSEAAGQDSGFEDRGLGLASQDSEFEDIESWHAAPVHSLHLSGYTVVDSQLGALGPVTAVDDRTLNILLMVDYKGDEILIPMAYVTAIQHHQKTINLSLPDGFLELYV